MDKSKYKKRKGEKVANTFGIEPLQHIFRTGHYFLIYLTPDMLIDGDNGSYFHQTLTIYMQILKKKLAQNRDDWMGLMICNVDNDDGIKIIHKFEQVSIDMYLTVMAAYEKDTNYYRNLIAQSDCSVANILQHVTREFGTATPLMTLQQIIFLTTIDHPAPEDPAEAHRIRLAADTFKALNIKLQTVGFGDEWDYERFYKDVEMLSERSSGRRYKKISLDELEGGISRRAHVIANLELRIADDAKVKVSLQNFTSKNRTILTQVTVNKDTNERLDRCTYFTFGDDLDIDDNNTQSDISVLDKYPQNILFNTHCGGKSLVLKGEQLNWMRKSRERGIDIIGFKNLPEELPKYQIQPALFVGCHCNASDKQMQFFATLLEKMNEKNVMAICAATLRDRSPVLLYALIPYTEYGGFYLHRIPYEEDVRTKVLEQTASCVANENLSITDSQVSLMKSIVKRLRLDQDSPVTVFNPTVQFEEEFIESLALHLPRRERPPDYTLPSEEISEMLVEKGYINKFKERFPNVVPHNDPKRQRLDPDAVDDTIRKKDYLRYTNDKLQAILRTIGESTSGRKSEMIERINAYRVKKFAD